MNPGWKSSATCSTALSPRGLQRYHPPGAPLICIYRFYRNRFFLSGGVWLCGGGGGGVGVFVFVRGWCCCLFCVCVFGCWVVFVLFFVVLIFVVCCFFFFSVFFFLFFCFFLCPFYVLWVFWFLFFVFFVGGYCALVGLGLINFFRGYFLFCSFLAISSEYSRNLRLRRRNPPQGFCSGHALRIGSAILFIGLAVPLVLLWTAGDSFILSRSHLQRAHDSMRNTVQGRDSRRFVPHRSHFVSPVAVRPKSLFTLFAIRFLAVFSDRHHDPQRLFRSRIASRHRPANSLMWIPGGISARFFPIISVLRKHRPGANSHASVPSPHPRSQ